MSKSPVRKYLEARMRWWNHEPRPSPGEAVLWEEMRLIFSGMNERQASIIRAVTAQRLFPTKADEYIGMREDFWSGYNARTDSENEQWMDEMAVLWAELDNLERKESIAADVPIIGYRIPKEEVAEFEEI
jgi:hypothetical protein